MLPLSEWQTLLAVQAGAAVTLTGLVFVAVSINLTRIVGVSGLAGRAAESIFQFLQVFFVCTVLLTPRQPLPALAVEILVITLLSWAAQMAAQIRYSRSRTGHPLLWLVARIVQTQLGSVPFFVAGVYLLLGWSSSLDWLVPGFLFSFAAGVANAWVLLIEINR